MNKCPYRPKKAVHFWRALFLSICMLAAIGAGAFYSIFHYTDKDFVIYHNLMAEANPTLAHKSEKVPYTASQQQQKVRKDFFFSKGAERRHCLLASRDVNVILDHQPESTEITEALEDIECYLQQELFYVDHAGQPAAQDALDAKPKQKVLFAQAEKAFMSYERQLFSAEKVHAVGFEAPGHQLSEDLLAENAPQFSMSLDARKAGYSDGRLSLQGAVRIKHPLGTAEAEKLSVDLHAKNKNGIFDNLSLKEDVVLTSDQYGKLTCQRAEFDFGSMRARFYGHFKRFPFVVYQSSPLEGSTLARPALTLKSRVMQMELCEDLLEPSKKQLNVLRASGDVSIDYGDMNLQGDIAVYERKGKSDLTLQTSKFPAEITLLPSELSSVCRLTNANHDQLTGSSMSFNTLTRKLQVASPKGFIKLPGGSLEAPLSDAQNLIDMQADLLLWELSGNKISLHGQVDIWHKELGSLKNDREVSLYYSAAKGKKQLQKIAAQGKTELCHLEGLKPGCHWLICQGQVLIDHEAKKARLSSDQNTQGQVPEGKQVFYHDQLGQVQADLVTIEYQEMAGKWVPVKFILEGNVYVVDHKGLNQGNQAGQIPLHYVLADYVEYTPHNKEMYFSSKSGRRVLFYDKINQLQVSAPALKITRDQVTKKEAIQGIGDVRFHFLNSELKQLLKRNLSTVGAGSNHRVKALT